MQFIEYDERMDPIAREQIADLFRVLMHPERLAILEMLRDGERCVCDIESGLGQRQAYVSQQLSVLRNAGLVESRRDKWRIIYRLTSPEVMAVIYTAQEILSRQSAQTAMN